LGNEGKLSLTGDRIDGAGAEQASQQDEQAGHRSNTSSSSALPPWPIAQQPGPASLLRGPLLCHVARTLSHQAPSLPQICNCNVCAARWRHPNPPRMTRRSSEKCTNRQRKACGTNKNYRDSCAEAARKTFHNICG